MAVRFAIASGNWSNTAIWDNGALPQPGDDVYANGNTVAIDQNVTVRSISNSASSVYVPNIATPAMINNVSPSGVVTGSALSTGGTLWNVFDQDLSVITVTAAANGGFFQYEFPQAKIIVRYAFYTGNNSLRHPATWTFDASNDGSNWTTLHSITGASLGTSSWYNYTFTNTTSYKYYRINVTAVSTPGNLLNMVELQMTESSSATNGGVSGGGFTLSAGYTINANLIVQGPGTLLSYTASSPTVATINGYVNMRINSGTTTLYGISHTGTGTLTINGDVYNNASTTGPAVTYGIYCTTNAGVLNINGNISSNPYTNRTDYLIYIASNFTINITGNLTTSGVQDNYRGSTTVWLTSPCTLNIIGDLYGSNTGTTGSLAYTTGVINCSAAASINITGNVYGPSATLATAAALGFCTAISISAAASLTITGNVIGGGSSGQGIYATSSPTITITGNIVGSGYQIVYLNGTGGSLSCTGIITAGTANAVFANSTAITCNLSGPFINTASGVMAVNAPVVRLTGSPTRWYLTNSGGGDRTLYSADFAPGYPNIQDVRSGVSYNGGLMTGTMVVPAASSVASGVPVGSTTGTAFITASQVSQAVWDYLLANMADPNSIGYRLKDASTVTTTGEQIEALNGL